MATVPSTALSRPTSTAKPAAVVQDASDDLDTDPTSFDTTLSAGAANATDISSIEAANGNGSIDGSSLTDIDGTAAAVVQAITDLDTDPTSFNTTSSLVLLMQPTSSIEAANGSTGTIDGSALTDINGTAADVVQALADLDTDPTSFDTTLTAGAVDVTDIDSSRRQRHRNHRWFGPDRHQWHLLPMLLLSLTDLDVDPTNFNSTLSAGAAQAADILSSKPPMATAPLTARRL